MKKTFVALALGLISNAAMANTGNIHFAGSITAGGTCPIEIVRPGTGGGQLPVVDVGSFHPEQFPTAGTKTVRIPFAMRITPGGSCTIGPNESGYVTFSALYGAHPDNATLYGLDFGGAGNLGLAIMDKSGTNLAPDTESVAYALDENKPTEMVFFASYQSTKDAVTPGDARSQVTYFVDIR